MSSKKGKGPEGKGPEGNSAESVSPPEGEKHYQRGISKELLRFCLNNISEDAPKGLWLLLLLLCCCVVACCCRYCVLLLYLGVQLSTGAPTTLTHTKADYEWLRYV